MNIKYLDICTSDALDQTTGIYLTTGTGETFQAQVFTSWEEKQDHDEKIANATRDLIVEAMKKMRSNLGLTKR